MKIYTQHFTQQMDVTMKLINGLLLAILLFSTQAMAGDNNAKTAVGGGLGAAAGTALGGIVGGNGGEVLGGAVGGELGVAVATKGDGQAGAVIGGAAGGVVALTQVVK